jgi:hypothetical protein
MFVGLPGGGEACRPDQNRERPHRQRTIEHAWFSGKKMSLTP